MRLPSCFPRANAFNLAEGRIPLLASLLLCDLALKSYHLARPKLSQQDFNAKTLGGKDARKTGRHSYGMNKKLKTDLRKFDLIATNISLDSSVWNRLNA